MKNLQTPFTVDCEGLSTKLILELADELRFYFEIVDISGDEITLDALTDRDFAGDVWALLKHYGVKEK